VEFFSNVSTERGTGWAGTVDTWVTYRISKNVRLDGGVYLGVTLRLMHGIHGSE